MLFFNDGEIFHFDYMLPFVLLFIFHSFSYRFKTKANWKINIKMKWNEWMNDQEQMTEGKMRTESNRLLEKKLLSWIKLLPSLYNWCVTVRQCHSVLKQRKSLKDKTTEKHMVRREKRVYVPSSVWLYLFQLFCRFFFCGRCFQAVIRLLGLHVLYAWFVQPTVNRLIYAEWKRELPVQIDMTVVDNDERAMKKKITIFCKRDNFLPIFINSIFFPSFFGISPVIVPAACCFWTVCEPDSAKVG